jgi:hypothetical protein
MRPKFLPCGNHKEFLLLTDREGSLGDEGGGGASEGCPQDTDVCLTLSGDNLNYNTTSDIKQFQIQHDNCISNASGGDTESNGLNTIVSIDQIISEGSEESFIPAGSGTLLVLSAEEQIGPSCLSSPQFYNKEGVLLSSSFSSGPTAPTGSEEGGESSPGDNISKIPSSVMSAGAWAELKEKIRTRRRELAENPQDGYNNNENAEGNTMNNNNINYQDLYEKANRQLVAMMAPETTKDVAWLKRKHDQLENDVLIASEAIDTASEVFATIPAVQKELSELREFVSRADQVISELESTSLGSHRLSELNDLVGDTYGEEDIPTLATMSEDTYAHLYESMNKVVSKIEDAAAQIEASSQKTSSVDQENKRILDAIQAVDIHKPAKGGDMLVKAARQDKMSAARNLISNALRR